MSEERLTGIEATLARIEATMVTKADLAEAIAGVAMNVDIAALGRQLRRLTDDIGALKDDLAVTTAIAQRVDNVTSRLLVDVLTEIRAEHSRMDRLLNRVRALEEPTP
jgi:uncharacterized coiled-coil protein SlyX